MAALELYCLNESTPQLISPQAGDTAVLPITLNAATGNEAALTLNYETNKAAGNDTGLLINMTDTASPGTSYPLDIKVGGTSMFSCDNIGQIVVDKGMTYGATSGIMFGNGDSGFAEYADNGIGVYIGGSNIWKLRTGSIEAVLGTGPSILSESPSATNPTMVANRVDLTSGLGWRATSVGVLVGGSQNCMEFGGVSGAPEVGFYGTAAIAQQTGIAVTAAGIHSALVSLGLITA